jgi:hypothetical protein
MDAPVDVSEFAEMTVPLPLPQTCKGHGLDVAMLAGPDAFN